MPRPIKREIYLGHWEFKGCYRKSLNGKPKTFGYGSPTDTDENYLRALAEWKEIVRKSGEDANRQKLADGGLEALLAMKTNGPVLTSKLMAAVGMPVDTQLADVMDRVATKQPVSQADVMFLMKRAGMLTTDQPEERTTGEMIDKFLKMKQQQSATGQKSVGRSANLQTYLDNFREFVGPTEPCKKIDEVVVSDYYAQLMEEMLSGEIGDYYARDRMQAMRQFVKWSWGLGALQLPKNIDSKELVIGVTAGEIEPMPEEALRIRIKAAEGRLKLEMILMANCGFYQKDCSDLKHVEVDWKKGAITRQRSKKQKGKEKNYPKVTWALWPSTFQLLREHASNDSPNVLVTRDGTPTVSSRIENGKAIRNDATGQAYRKLQNKLIPKWDAEELPKLSNAEQLKWHEEKILDLVEGKLTFARWQLMSIRKTSSTAIGNSKEHSRYAQYFLAQAPETTANDHYVKPSAEQFHDCCIWLGKHLGLDTMEKLTTDEA